MDLVSLDKMVNVINSGKSRDSERERGLVSGNEQRRILLRYHLMIRIVRPVPHVGNFLFLPNQSGVVVVAISYCY